MAKLVRHTALSPIKLLGPKPTMSIPQLAKNVPQHLHVSAAPLTHILHLHTLLLQRLHRPLRPHPNILHARPQVKPHLGHLPLLQLRSRHLASSRTQSSGRGVVLRHYFGQMVARKQLHALLELVVTGAEVEVLAFEPESYALACAIIEVQVHGRSAAIVPNRVVSKRVDEVGCEHEVNLYPAIEIPAGVVAVETVAMLGVGVIPEAGFID